MTELIRLSSLDMEAAAGDDRHRSLVMRDLINGSLPSADPPSVPRTIVQFWDTPLIPEDVSRCLETWSVFDAQGFQRLVFDHDSARSFIADNFDEQHVLAFAACLHPAMQADYFRLCFIYIQGGIYIDADDEYLGGSLESVLSGQSLKLDPLCYRISSDSMEDPFSNLDDTDDLIFYVNNNPLAAPPQHPLVKSSLDQATARLTNIGVSRDVQKLSGPGNLTEALVRHALGLVRDGEAFDFEILREWSQIAESKWPLDYRQDDNRRMLSTKAIIARNPLTVRDLRWDQSPWIAPKSDNLWNGIHVSEPRKVEIEIVEWSLGEPFNLKDWKARDDTFPSNLALFQPDRVSASENLELELRESKSSVRDYSAGAIAATRSQLYGSYSAELRAARGSGIITGLFLHRNGPRQEIDIEFRGRDTTKMLVNVFYNPGPLGTKLEYGYRGTPTEIDLGFDAADDFHLYEIDWQPDCITWKVDGAVVYSRVEWDPTPIPDRPLEFNINIWTSRSTEFAGVLDSKALPAKTSVRSIKIS